RHRENRAKAGQLNVGDKQRIALDVGRFDRDIRDAYHLLCFEYAAQSRPWARTDQPTLTVFRKRWRRVVQRGRMKPIAVTEIQYRTWPRKGALRPPAWHRRPAAILRAY